MTDRQSLIALGSTELGRYRYRGTVDPSAFNENVLNDYEKKNAAMLSNREFSMESGGYKLDQY